MEKKTRDWLVVASVCVLSGLLIYVALTWFFPAVLFSLVPMSVLTAASLYLAIESTPFSSRPGPLTPFKFFAGLLLMSFILWVAVGVGTPAVLMTLLGPNETITVVVLKKDAGGRGCRHRVQLSELSGSFNKRLCVSASLHNRISERQRVSLLVRQNVFGTRIFQINPS